MLMRMMMRMMMMMMMMIVGYEVIKLSRLFSGEDRVS